MRNADDCRTFRLLKAQALRGDAELMWLVGTAYRDGHSQCAGQKKGVLVRRNVRLALHWLERAAEKRSTGGKVMDVKRCSAMIVTACALGLHAEFFNSFVVTNSHCQAASKRTTCVMAQDARSVVIEPGGLDSDELALAKSLVFLSLRKRSVCTEVSVDIDEPVRLRVTPFEGWTDYDLSFSYFGARIDAYDVQCVPFVVTNRRNNHRMKVALFKFMKNGRFAFAEYANLNALQVSPIFARNYTMRTYLAYQSEFPWLSEKEVVRQNLILNGMEAKIMKCHRRYERMLLPYRQTHSEWRFVG